MKKMNNKLKIDKCLVKAMKYTNLELQDATLLMMVNYFISINLIQVTHFESPRSKSIHFDAFRVYYRFKNYHYNGRDLTKGLIDSSLVVTTDSVLIWAAGNQIEMTRKPNGRGLVSTTFKVTQAEENTPKQIEGFHKLAKLMGIYHTNLHYTTQKIIPV